MKQTWEADSKAIPEHIFDIGLIDYIRTNPIITTFPEYFEKLLPRKR